MDLDQVSVLAISCEMGIKFPYPHYIKYNLCFKILAKMYESTEKII